MKSFLFEIGPDTRLVSLLIIAESLEAAFRSADGRTVQIRADFLGSIWVNDVRYVPAK